MQKVSCLAEATADPNPEEWARQPVQGDFCEPSAASASDGTSDFRGCRRAVSSQILTASRARLPAPATWSKLYFSFAQDGESECAGCAGLSGLPV